MSKLTKGIKLYDLIKCYTKEVWYAGECKCGESKYDLITTDNKVYAPVHESTIRKVKPSLLRKW